MEVKSKSDSVSLYSYSENEILGHLFIKKIAIDFMYKMISLILSFHPPSMFAV